MRGDRVAGGVSASLALRINGSSSAPRLSIVILKTHLAITSIVNALNSLNLG